MVKLRVGQSKVVSFIPINPTTILISSDVAFMQTWKNVLADKCGATQFASDLNTAWQMTQKLKNNVELVIIDSPSDRLSATNLYKWCQENLVPSLWVDNTKPANIAEKDFVKKPIEGNILAQKILNHKRKVTGHTLK